MQAVQVVAPKELAVVAAPEPAAGPGALLRIDRVGICGTDVKVFKGAIPVHYPRIMGHEAIAEVIEPGDLGITSTGDRVLIDPATSCGYCDICRAGRSHICRNGGLMGRDDDGVFADFVRAPEARLIQVPPSIGDTASGLLQVLGTVIHAQRAVRVFPGDVVAVLGLGVAGLLMVQILRERGATVIGVTRSEWKRDLASRFGAHAVAPPDEAQSVIDDFTNGRGVDVGVEAAGKESTLSTVIEWTRIGGEILVFGTLTGGNEGLPYYQFYSKELTIHNPRAAMPTDYERGIALTAAGKLDLDPIVTHRFGIDEAAGAFEAVQDSSSLKVLMTP